MQNTALVMNIPDRLLLNPEILRAQLSSFKTRHPTRRNQSYFVARRRRTTKIEYEDEDGETLSRTLHISQYNTSQKSTRAISRASHRQPDSNRPFEISIEAVSQRPSSKIGKTEYPDRIPSPQGKTVYKASELLRLEKNPKSMDHESRLGSSIMVKRATLS